MKEYLGHYYSSRTEESASILFRLLKKTVGMDSERVPGKLLCPSIISKVHFEADGDGILDHDGTKLSLICFEVYRTIRLELGTKLLIIN